MNEAPPRYDADPGNTTLSTSSSEVAILQTQIIELQRQVARLSETRYDQLLKHSIIADPPLYNGKSWFNEWYWKMIGKLEEFQSVDEKTKLDYVVSRLTESAFSMVEIYLPQRLRPEQFMASSRQVRTADDLMRILKKKYS